MNFDKIIIYLRELAETKEKKQLTFDDYLYALNNKEIKDYLDKKYKELESILANQIPSKNYLLRQLLEIYFMENDIEILDAEETYSDKDLDILTLLFNDISRYKVLSKEEEVELFTKYNETKDPELKKLIANHNIRLVVSIARRYSRQSQEYLKEAIQDGCEGLLVAIDKFDVNQGNKFATCAYWWISQSIQRNNINYNRTVRLPVHMAEKVNKISLLINNYVIANGTEPSDDYLAEKLNTTIDNIKKIKATTLEPVSVDIPVGEDDHGEESTLLDFIEDDSNNSNVEKIVLDDTLKLEIRKALEHLKNDRERMIIIRRYGLDDNIPHTLEEVGQECNVTRERIRQIEAKALGRIRRTRKDLKDYLR